jgi:head-tail adaptor
MISNGLLFETFYPLVNTVTDDGMGGQVTTEVDGTAFQGRLSSLNSNEMMSQNKITLESSHKLFCDYQVIDESSRIRNSDSTRYFQIKGIVNPSNANHHLEIFVLEV